MDTNGRSITHCLNKMAIFDDLSAGHGLPVLVQRLSSVRCRDSEVQRSPIAAYLYF